MKNTFKFRRAKALFNKEFKHIFRDPFTLTMALLLPLLIVLILGNSIEFNIKQINLGVLDFDKTQSSRLLTETFTSSDYFRSVPLNSSSEAFHKIMSEQIRSVLIIPPSFEKGTNPTAQILLDGADNSSIAAVMNYLTAINQRAPYKIKDVPVQNQSPLQLKSRFLFNPELDSKWFGIPGISAVIIALVAIMLTTLTICKEWEQGSMEMLLSTPATTSEIIVGKLFPYAILSFIGFLIVFLAAEFVFKVPFVGNFGVLVLGTLLFIFGYLAMGLYISITCKKQEVAVQYAAVIGLLPTAMLSGFVFPIEYMPKAYRIVASLFPARFYVEISRDQFLKGSSLTELSLPLLALLIQFLILWACCLLKFKRTLE